MKIKEFNEKYKDYLEEGHYGLDINDPCIINYLDEIFQGLIKIPGFKYSQIKEKFHTGRFYTNLREILGKADYITNKVESELTLFLNYIQYNKDNE
jgi:hypothetical protein